VLFEKIKDTIILNFPSEMGGRYWIANAGQDLIELYAKTHELEPAQRLFEDLYVRQDRLIPDSLLHGQSERSKPVRELKCLGQMQLTNLYLEREDLKRALSIFPNPEALEELPEEIKELFRAHRAQIISFINQKKTPPPFPV
jgi:hypothetical protein